MKASRRCVAHGLRSRFESLWVGFIIGWGLVLDDADVRKSGTWIRLSPSSFLSEPLKLSLLPPSAKRATR
jgi:hypothetical protein